MKRKPKIFYKYCTVERALEIIETSQIWYSPVDELNDLYEGKYTLSDELLRRYIKPYTDSIWPQAKDKFLGLQNEDEFYEYFLRMTRKASVNKFYNVLFRSSIHGGYSVFSLSTTNKSELMWSHYADRNAGVCLQFDLSKDPKLRDEIYPVEYSNETFNADSNLFPLEANLRKRKVWRYEKEWRLVSRSNGLQPINKLALTGIFLGFHITEENTKIIERAVSKAGNNKVKTHHFELAIGDVPYVHLPPGTY